MSIVAKQSSILATAELMFKQELTVAEMGDGARAKWAENKGLLRAPFRGWEAGSPSKTMSPGPRPTSVPSGILIHATVWPKYTNVTDRQTGHTTVP